MPTLFEDRYILATLVLVGASALVRIAYADPVCPPIDPNVNTEDWPVKEGCPINPALLKKTPSPRTSRPRLTVEDMRSIPGQEKMELDSGFVHQIRCMFRKSPSKIESGAFVVLIDGSYQLVGLKNGDHNTVESVCLSSAVAEIHTHFAGLGAKPTTTDTKNDWKVATTCNLPVYVLSVFEIWKIQPGGSEPSMKLVAKDWTNWTEKCE